MRLSPAVALAIVALLVVSPIGTVTATSATAPALASTEDVETPLQSDDPKQVIRIDVAADGDARWTIESRYLLEDDDDVERFEAYADSVTDDDRDATLDSGYDIAIFETALERAESSTDREMAITDDGWDEPRIESPEDDEDHEIGVIAYSVTWSNFAAVDDNRLHLGDVFWDDDGSWFPRLSDSQRLVIEPPENYGFENPPIGTQNGALVWDGPYVFAQDELEVTFLEGVTSGSGTGGSPDGTGGSPSLSAPLIGIGVLLLVIVGVGDYLLSTRDPLSRILGSDDRSDDEPSTPSTHERPGEATLDADVRAPTQEINPELLSDEERVHRLLEQNGGRMKQAMIVEETGWSNAKVSQLLSKMDDDGEIDKLRIGRENLINLPDVDPTETE